MFLFRYVILSAAHCRNLLILAWKHLQKKSLNLSSVGELQQTVGLEVKKKIYEDLNKYILSLQFTTFLISDRFVRVNKTEKLKFLIHDSTDTFWTELNMYYKPCGLFTSLIYYNTHTHITHLSGGG